MFLAARDTNFQTEHISILKQHVIWNCAKISMIDSIVLSWRSPTLFRWNIHFWNIFISG